jgi:hypothetical protein
MRSDKITVRTGLLIGALVASICAKELLSPLYVDVNIITILNVIIGSVAILSIISFLVDSFSSNSYREEKHLSQIDRDLPRWRLFVYRLNTILVSMIVIIVVIWNIWE